MSLRKITTLILLAAFALTQVPVQAATLTITGSAPSVIVDAGTAANGANRDVVPVTLAIDTLSTGEVFFGTYTGTGTFAVTENGQLTTGGATLAPATSTYVTVIQPPLGAEFVGLAGYTSNVTTAAMDPTAGGNTGSLVNVSSANLPTAADRDTAILAKIITQDGPASTFGTVIPKGSIVMYTITNAASNTTTGPSDITFNNIGLAVPAGSTLTTFNATYKEVIIGLAVNEAVPSLTEGATIAVATLGTAGTSQINVALDSEPDAQSNSVLADLLADNSSTVKVNTNNVTTSTVNAAILNVDTDALLIRAAEVTTGVFYNTPFNTSSFLGAVANGTSATLLNAPLTGSAFPNSANALITVTYSLVPLTGNGATDATLVVDAASVSLQDDSGASGFLGALAVTPTINGSGAITPANFAVSVLYNGASATGALPVVDFDLLNDATTNVTGSVAAAVGFTFAAPNADPLASTSATGTPFNVANGTLQTGIFPGVTVAQADALGTTPGVVQTAGALTPFTVVATGFAGATIGEAVWVANEVTARLLPTGGNAIFAFTGNQATTSLVTTKEKIRIGPTNLAIVPYNTAAFVQGDENDTDVRNNAIAVAKLSGNTVQIMPLVNKVDAVRDVIKVRPEATITLGANSRAQGVKLIATVTGNNIVGSQVVEIARINASGSTNANVTVSSLPAAGTLDRLLAENGTSASTLRVALNLSSVNNVPATDELKDLIANGSVLDNTLPSFFCGGTAGNLTKGPNAVPQQPYARAVLVQEAAAAAFAEVRVSANDRIRFTLPVGVDLVKTSLTASSNDVAVIATDGGAAGTFAATPTITAYQTISEQNGGQAFIDVSLPNVVAGTTTVKNAIALIFGRYSLVIPEGQTNFDATVTLVNDDTTTGTSSDITLDTLGTAPLATGCAQQFTISYCEDALANFAQGDGPVVSNIIANGSLLTSFGSDVSSSVRLLNEETGAFRIPDICVTESVSDALFVTPAATTANIFGPGTTISLALSDPGDDTVNSNNIGFAGAGTIDTSDDSVAFGATGIAGGLLNSATNAGTGTDSFLETTTIRFTGITLGKTLSNFQPSVQNITVFTRSGNNHIATSLPAAYETRGANGTGLSTVRTGLEEEVINTFFNGDGIAIGAASDIAGSFVNGEFLALAFAGNSAKLLNAVKTINDTASAYSQLSEATKLSIAVDDIAAVTGGLAAYTRITVFTSAGDLEPGSIITITSGTDSVSVPVMDDGNFIAQLRGVEGDTLVLVQTPKSDQATADQTVIVEAQDQNLEPTLLSAVAQNFTSIGTVTEQGLAPVLFKLTSVGRIGADVFIPTASQLTVGGSPVYAVPGTDDMFLAIIDFKKTNGTTVTANVTGSPSVGITGLDSDFPTFAKSSRPTLVKVEQKTRKDGDTRIVFKGSKLRNAGVGYIVTTTGSVQEVTFRARTSSDRQANRVVSQGTATIPSNALFGVYHVRGRGISTIDLSN